MEILTQIQNCEQLKLTYRQLAMKYHPDKGGDAQMFIKLNSEYKELFRHFELIAKGLENVRVGDIVFVNGTECMVNFVGNDIFIAQAVGRLRKDVFYKSTGIGKYNSQFKASTYNQYFKAN